MIGLKLQNFIWEKALLSVLGNRAEKWQENQSYTLILTDLSKSESANFHPQAPLIGLGKTGLALFVPLPIKKSELEKFLSDQISPCENHFFIWDKRTRQLTYKKTKKVIPLTEKESDILTYLYHNPNHQATKAELLKNVWHYTEETESHTVETTVHALRQKIGKNANQLLLFTPTGYRLA